MNKAILFGRITKDVEIKNTTNGKTFAKFTVAVDRKFKDAQGNKLTDFINCVAWGKTAETIAQYFHKGSPILVEGEIQTRTYDDANGQKVYVTEVLVSEFSFTINDNRSTGNEAPATAPQVAPEIIVDDDDVGLPFEV